MQIIRKRTYARAGLLGNPSDGYHGKTISISVRNFWSDVVLYEWDFLEIVPTQSDHTQFRSVYDLAEDVRLHGYYGGIRLIKATIKRFVDYCQAQNIQLHKRNFSIRYESNIPRQVGLAGSSSLIITTLRCLMAFYEVEIPQEILPSLALAVEIDELGIGAGLQDRVIQCYEGMVFMDFDISQQRECNGLTHYHYESLVPPQPLPLYIAYHTDLSEPTEIFHNDIRGRYNRGEPTVVNAMHHFADLATQGYHAIQQANRQQLHKLINENFDTRQRISQLPDWQTKMVLTARSCGASAKFAGSGGAIIGLYDGENMFAELQNQLRKIGSLVIKPQIFPHPSTLD